MKKAIIFFTTIIGHLLLAASCSDNSPTAPEPSTGVIEVITSSGEQDKEYTITVDGTNDFKVNSNVKLVIPDLEEGLHEIELSGMASHCEVNGNNPQSATVTRGDTTSVSFAVFCMG